jgi:hypothetical protein
MTSHISRNGRRLRSVTAWVAAFAGLAGFVSAAVPAFAGEQPGQPQRTPPIGRGKLVSLSVLPEAVALKGTDRVQQVVITGHYENGGVRDLTGTAKLEIADHAVARLDDGALIVPIANGKTRLVATAEGKTAEAPLTVAGLERETPINFANEIVPVFGKLGCNGGGCHGKLAGQNGFRLSLLGYEPTLDYETVVREARGRRVFPAAPERSLLLTKGTGIVPHGGGRKMEPGSPEYKLIVRWIRSGMPYGEATDPKVVGITVSPTHRIVAMKSSQQITVTAHYSNGVTEDITRVAEFVSNDPEIAAVDEDGRVRTNDIPGEGAVMARHLGHVAVFRVTVPQNVTAEQLAKVAKPAPQNVVDTHVFAKLEQLGVAPSALCTDEEFIRRASLDICGTLPKAEEVSRFLADKDPKKRAKLVDELLERPEYAAFFTVKWCDILRNSKGNARQGVDAVTPTIAFHGWVRQALAENMPYDRFVRSVVAAQGNVMENPPVAWYRELTKPENLVDDVAQAFLGTRIQCARCHHHPYEKWGQDDYWSFASFFARIGRKNPVGSSGRQGTPANIFVTRKGVSANPNTGKQLAPRGLAGDELAIGPDEDPRQRLVDWMTDAKNPFFAPAVVNRYWAHFMGRGIVEPIDDMRVTNPPSNPELLAALSDDFIAGKFDLKRLVRVICNSAAYQLSAVPNEFNRSDKRNFARYQPKRLSAEVLLDALDAVTAAPTGFSAMPAGTRAIELPDEAGGNYFLTVFGKPKRDTACECERSPDANLAQSLHLLNSNEVQGKLTAPNGRAAKLAADARPDAEKIDELWLTVFARRPADDEARQALEYLQRKTDPKAAAATRKQAYEDVIWALVNTKEFLFNH